MNNKKIVLLDLWTDSNRGDNCLQSGLIGMTRQRWPGCEVTGVFRFGINEFAKAGAEISETVSQLDRAYGGLRKTYYSAPNHKRYTGITHQLVSLYSFFELFFVLLLSKLRLQFILPTGHQDVIRVVREADLVIWKGKNFRDYGGLPGINRQLTLLIAGIVGYQLNRNICCVNASVWNMRNFWERRLAGFVLAKCKVVTVRDKASEENLKFLCGEKLKIFFAQDLSFFDLDKNYNAVGKKRSDALRAQYDLAFTITEWGKPESQKIYIDTICMIARELKSLGVNRIAIVPQVTRSSESNAGVLQKITASVPDVNFEIIDGSPKIGQLLDIYERSEMVVGTRMHSCVFARSVGTPFVAIAYDAGPKWEILSEFWPKQFIFEYSSPSERVVAAAKELYQNRGFFLTGSQAAFQRLSAESYKNVSVIDI